MRIYYFSKRGLMSAAFIAVLLAGFLGFSFMYYNDISIATHMAEPIYQGNTGQKNVAITVNVDWGEEYIPQMLAEFKKHEALATFYVTGTWAEKNQDLLKEMVQEGHSIQNHGYQHLHFNTLTRDQMATQIKKGEQAIQKITGRKTTFFTPPYGEQNRQLMAVISELDYHLTMWSVDTIDWQRPEPKTIVKRVINKVHNDAIILMHPTEPTAKALPDMLTQLKQDGYKMITVEKIVIMKDVKIKGDTQTT
ncbi:MAG: polysaccharide deacetylase family protein [Syntrophomonadaceae bacterium]|nr:polysaccharide deacetylase family protein [Bacillota bacterium]HQA49206.1 polysaccharide deacetylase family protein [Syntrophomonadaceae bacterium]HQD89397.1 polysaccharide deacetylase family protein [Syntrophomonadaceae bacterium]